jgi:hypothetical protein
MAALAYRDDKRCFSRQGGEVRLMMSGRSFITATVGPERPRNQIAAMHSRHPIEPMALGNARFEMSVAFDPARSLPESILKRRCGRAGRVCWVTFRSISHQNRIWEAW